MARRHWTERPRLLALRRRSAAINAGARAYEHYRVHRTGRNAALIAHYGFLSIFPLYLAFTTVLGLILEDNPDLADDIIDSALNRIPIIGQQIATAPTELTGSIPVLVIGLGIALWGGMRAFNAIQWALDDIREVPFFERRTLVQLRLWSMIGILVVGGAQVATAITAGYVGTGRFEIVHEIALLASILVVHWLVVASTYRWLCSRPPTWRQLWPGATSSAIAFFVLQVFGTTIVTRAIARASPVYGTFASVIALLAWLSLHSMVALLGAELNQVLPARRLAAAEPVTS